MSLNQVTKMRYSTVIVLSFFKYKFNLLGDPFISIDLDEIWHRETTKKMPPNEPNPSIVLNSEHRHAREKPLLSTNVEVLSLLLLNCIWLQRLGDIHNYLVYQTKPIFATPTTPMGSKIGVEGCILACPDSVPASIMQL